MAAAWAAFGPAQFGGQAYYVIVAGSSMEPALHRGDLVVLRYAVDYAAGDIVTYRHPEIGRVIHRLIGREGERFVFKGDNNAWVDQYRPTQADLIGKLWFVVPGAGKLIGALRTPKYVAALAATVGMLFVGIGRTEGKAGDRSGPRKERLRAMKNLGETKGDVLFLLAVLAFASLLLGWTSFARPVTHDLPDAINYEQTGDFAYSAPAASGVYDARALSTGEPVFRRLTRRVQVSFDYRFNSPRPHLLLGTYSLAAEIADTNGWKRTIELQPETAVVGDRFTAQGIIDLGLVRAMIDELEARTGIDRQTYTLAVLPRVAMTGTLAGRAVSESFTPRLEFQLDDLQMQLARAADDDTDPLRPVQPGAIEHFRAEPNTILILGLELRVSMARWLSAVLLVLAAAGSAALVDLSSLGGRGRGSRRAPRSLRPIVMTGAPRAGTEWEVPSDEGSLATNGETNPTPVRPHRRIAM